MRDLFDTEDGIGLSYLRQPMGASDFVEGPALHLRRHAEGKTDFDMARFSVAHDEKQILPLLRQALRHNRDLKVMGTPWSPPAWMKDPESLVGGRFIDDERYYDAYTKYFVKFVQAYRGAGVPVDAVTLQNEPQNRFPFKYPGMDFRDPEEARLIKSVGPAFQKAGIDTKILGYDHNWSLHPNDVGLPGANPQYAQGAARRPGGQALARRHGLPLLLGRPERAVGAARPRTPTATSTSRSARASSRATRRRRSRTRCTGTRAS